MKVRSGYKKREEIKERMGGKEKRKSRKIE
jgi:hypothetical protein